MFIDIKLEGIDKSKWVYQMGVKLQFAKWQVVVDKYVSKSLFNEVVRYVAEVRLNGETKSAKDFIVSNDAVKSVKYPSQKSDLLVWFENEVGNLTVKRNGYYLLTYILFGLKAPNEVISNKELNIEIFSSEEERRAS